MFGELRELLDYETSVRAVTAEGIRAVARKWFDPERRVEGIVRGEAVILSASLSS